jgi:hypothetical protein
MAEPTPPGWYPDPRGIRGAAYWNGSAWQLPPKRTNSNLKALFIAGPIILGFLLFGACLSAIGNHDSTTTTSTSSVAEPPIASYIPTTSSSPPAVNVDDVFIAAIQRSGMTVTNRDAAIAAGHAVCLSLDKGATTSDIIGELMSGGYSAKDAGSIMGISIAAYCPRYRGLIPG